MMGHVSAHDQHDGHVSTHDQHDGHVSTHGQQHYYGSAMQLIDLQCQIMVGWNGCKLDMVKILFGVALASSCHTFLPAPPLSPTTNLF